MPQLILNGAGMRQMNWTGIGIFDVMRRVVLLMIVLTCVLVSGCKAPITWSAESRSPDGKMVTTAETDDESGPGTDSIQTTVYLNWASGSQPKMLILAFSDGPAGPDGMKVEMNWLTPKHLELTYKGQRALDFQAVKCAGIDISVRDASSGAVKSTQ
jgi:hypothetical protein